MNNLKAEQTLTSKNRVSDERLESLRKWYATYPGWKHDNLSNLEIASMVSEIQRLRSQPLSTQQPMGEVTDVMVERAHAAYAKTTGGMLDGNPMQNALNASLHPNQESGE